MQALFYKKVNRAVSPVTRTKKTGGCSPVAWEKDRGCSIHSKKKQTGDIPLSALSTCQFPDASSAAAHFMMMIGITTMPHMTMPKREIRLPQ